MIRKEFMIDNYLAGVIRAIAPSQDRWECLRMLEIIEDELDEPVVVEIGVDIGSSARLWQYVLDPKILIGIDNNRIARGVEDWHYIVADSHEPNVVGLVQELIGDKAPGIDFLWLDGDHTYEGVKKDYELYSPLVKPGGIIGFHDVMLDDKENHPECRVCEFWQELKTAKDFQKSIEIHNPNLGGTGVGLIWR